MAENEPTTVIAAAGDVAELTPNNNSAININNNDGPTLPEVAGLLLIPDPLSPNTIERCQRRLTKEAKSRIEAGPTQQQQCRPPPMTRLSRRPQRKKINYKEVDSPLIEYDDDDDDDEDEEDAKHVDGNYADDRSATEDTLTVKHVTRKVPIKEPRHTTKKHVPQSQPTPAAAAETADPGNCIDGTIEEASDNNSHESNGVVVPAAKKNGNQNDKDDEDEEPFILAPPTLLQERQSSLDRLIRDALPISLSPSLTDWYQKGVLIEQPPEDVVAMTAVFDQEHHPHRHSITSTTFSAATTPMTDTTVAAEARSALLDKYRTIVMQWPPLAVQINNASVRAEDGRIIAPPLLPPPAVGASLRSILATKPKAPPGREVLSLLGDVTSMDATAGKATTTGATATFVLPSSSSTTTTYDKKRSAEAALGSGRCRNKLDRMQAPGAYPRQVHQLMQMNCNSVKKALGFIRIPCRTIPTVTVEEAVHADASDNNVSAVGKESSCIRTGTKRRQGTILDEPLMKRAKTTSAVTYASATM
jgi:hypothetical protein